MEQQNIPNTHVVYITQPPNEERDRNFKDAYSVKAAMFLGVVHIMCGLIAFSSELHVILNGSPRNFSIGAGIWTSVFFVVSGGLSIGGARSGSKCLVVSTMMMSIISAVCAGGLLIASPIGWDINTYGPYSYYSRGYRLCAADSDGVDHADCSHHLSLSHMQASLLPPC